MKKTKLYTVTGICVILAAITLVTTKNTNITGASGIKQTEIHQDKRISKQTFVNDETGNRAVTSVNNKVKDASASQTVLSAVSTQKSYNAYVCEDDSQLLYIQDRATDNTQTITVEPHLATGIMSLEWPDDKMIVAFSHVSPFMGCMSVYDASTQELLLEKYCSSYAFGDTLDSLAYVEATSGDSGNHKLLNSEDKLLYQTEKKERITNIAVNHTNGDIAIVVGKYLKDGETQKFHVVLLAKRGDKYIKVKTQRVKLNSVNSVQWKDDEQIIITNDAGKEVIRK